MVVWSGPGGSNSGSGGNEALAAPAATVRLPPSIRADEGERPRPSTPPPRQTTALTAAVVAARASTAGAAAGIEERVGSRDVEIRLPASFTPLERIAISAEGDLQRIVASYYNAAVTVGIRRCLEVEPGLFDREVDLSVLGQVGASLRGYCSPCPCINRPMPD